MSAVGYFTLLFDPNSELKEKIWTTKTREIILGRSHQEEPKYFIAIVPKTGYKDVSRKHAKVLWNQKKNCWDLEVLGKSLWSNKKLYQQNETLSLSMAKPTPIQIGKKCKFYFIPPDIIS